MKKLTAFIFSVTMVFMMIGLFPHLEVKADDEPPIITLELTTKTKPEVVGQNVYANGFPIVIIKGTQNNTTTVFWDRNGNGTLDESTNSDIDEKIAGATNQNMSSWSIYGGTEGQNSDSLQNDYVTETKITMVSGYVKTIYGGGLYGKVQGSTNVAITSGTVSSVYGGGARTIATVDTANGIVLNGTANTDTFNNLLYKNSGGNLVVKGNAGVLVGATLTILNGETLTVPDDSTLTNNGTIINNGTIDNKGTIDNTGTIIQNGTVSGNTISVNIVIPAPIADVKSDTYISTQTVKLSTGTNGATIYYTTNGNTPTEASTQYTKPITVSTSTTIKAIAVCNGYDDSSVATFDYVINIPAPTPTPTPSASSTTDTTPSISSADKVVESLKNAKNGEKVTIYGADGKALSKDIIKSLKESKANLEIKYNGYTWAIDGSTITDTDKDIDLTVTKISGTLTGDVLGFDIAYSGDLPFEAKITMDVPGYIKEGTEVYLYKIVNGQRAFQSSAKTSGYSATFQRNSASEYVVSLVKPDDLSAGEGAFENVTPLQIAQNGIPFLIISIVLVAGIVVYKKKLNR